MQTGQELNGCLQTMEKLPLTDMKNKLVKLLSSLVARKSTYPDEKKITDFICKFLNKYQFKYIKQKVANNRYNLIVEKGEGKKSVALYAHLDTVDLTGHWNTNPLKLTVKKDCAYGLGAWDMKAGLAVNLLTFLNYNPKNFKLQIILCVDEENISQGAYQLAKSKNLNQTDCIISTEPAFCYGNQGVVIGRIGRAVFEIQLSYPSAHFYQYEKNTDINLLAAQIINQLSMFSKTTKNKEKQFIFLRNITTKTTGLSTPENTILEFDSSIIPPLNNQGALSYIKKSVLKVAKNFDSMIKVRINFKTRKTPYLSAYKIDSKNNYLELLVQSVKSTTHQKAHTYFRSSVADENVFGLIGKTVLGIGPVGGNAHAPNEWVSIQSLYTLYLTVTDFLKKVDNNLNKS